MASDVIITDVQERILNISNPQPEYIVFKDGDGTHECFVASPQNALAIARYICDAMPWVLKEINKS